MKWLDNRKAAQRLALLNDRDYFRFSDTTKLVEMQQELLKWLLPSDKSLTGPYLNDEQFDKRSFLSDAENLAEGGIPFEIERLQIIFNKLEIRKPQVAQSIDEKHYTVTVDNKEYPIYSETDLSSGIFWGLSALGTIKIINDILVNNQKQERAYLLYPGGNDQILVILTASELELLCSFGKEKPYDQERMQKELDAR
jgi:hypothetical protein